MGFSWGNSEEVSLIWGDSWGRENDFTTGTKNQMIARLVEKEKEFEQNIRHLHSTIEAQERQRQNGEAAIIACAAINSGRAPFSAGARALALDLLLLARLVLPCAAGACCHLEASLLDHGVLEAELAASGETDAEKSARLAAESRAEQGLTRLKRVLNNKAKRVDARAARVASASSKRQRDNLGPPEVMRLAGTTPPAMWNRHFFATTGIPVNGVLVPEATFKRSRMPDVNARGGVRQTFGNRLVVDHPPDQALDRAFAHIPDFRGKPERSLQEEGPVFDPRQVERAMAKERKKARAKASKAGEEPGAWAAVGQTDDEQSDSDWER